MAFGLEEAIGLGVGGGLVSGLFGSSSQSKALRANRRMQERQWQQYLETLKPEWRFTPEQISLQEAMVPQYQAQMAYATGLNDLFYTPPEAQPDKDLLPQMQSLDEQIRSAETILKEEFSGQDPTFTPGGLSRYNALKRNLDALKAQKTSLADQMAMPIDSSPVDDYTPAFERELARQQQLGEAQRLGYEKLAGESLGQIGQARLAQQQQILGAGRRRYGEAIGGQTLQDILTSGEQLQGRELQARMYPEQAMMGYKTGLLGQAQQGLQDYMTMPLGNLPAGMPPEPMFQSPDMTIPNTMNDLMSTYMLYNMMGQGGGGQNIQQTGGFTPPASLYPSQNVNRLPWSPTPASIDNPFDFY